MVRLGSLGSFFAVTLASARRPEVGPASGSGVEVEAGSEPERGGELRNGSGLASAAEPAAGVEVGAGVEVELATWVAWDRDAFEAP